ncbi:MAG: hypothetical protein Q9M39_08085 [Sulfurovum sp.]|nr:hypothetical protein [Sulfurovum sp.]
MVSETQPATPIVVKKAPIEKKPIKEEPVKIKKRNCADHGGIHSET